jgi:hypothetical protein
MSRLLSMGGVVMGVTIMSGVLACGGAPPAGPAAGSGDAAFAKLVSDVLEDGYSR